MRLIDADALKEAFWNVSFVYDEEGENGRKNHDVSDMVAAVSCNAIDNAPTIDAVPVVRCRDCKWWDDRSQSCELCTVGERKDND